MPDMLLDVNEARHFVSTLTNPTTGPAPAHSCAGGVPECADFRTVLDRFLTDAHTFLQNIDRGFNGLRDAVTACYLDYDDTDHTQADKIAANGLQVEPAALSERLRSKGQGWTEDPQ